MGKFIIDRSPNKLIDRKKGKDIKLQAILTIIYDLNFRKCASLVHINKCYYTLLDSVKKHFTCNDWTVYVVPLQYSIFFSKTLPAAVFLRSCTVTVHWNQPWQWCLWELVSCTDGLITKQQYCYQ